MATQLTVRSQAATAGATVVSGKVAVRSVKLTAGAGAAAVYQLLDGGAGGTIKARGAALQGTVDFTHHTDDDLLFGTDIHAIVTGAGAVVDIYSKG